MRIEKASAREFAAGHWLRIDTRSAPRRVWVMLQAMRVNQWVKNALIFVPLIAAHKVSTPGLFWDGCTAFLSFSFCASGIYLINDIVDVEADRRHPTKRDRPIAAGQLSRQAAMILAVACIGASLVTASTLPVIFLMVLASYLLITVAYSVWLKSIAILDVLTLAGLYTVRIFAGAVAVVVPLSPWLLAFSMFVFLSLAFVKRYAELRLLEKAGRTEALGRAYIQKDLPSLYSMGTASGYIAVLVLALYINSDHVVSLYRRPEYLWALCPLAIYWISRMWFRAARGELHDDPIIAAFEDRQSLIVGVLAAVAMVAAL